MPPLGEPCWHFQVGDLVYCDLTVYGHSAAEWLRIGHEVRHLRRWGMIVDIELEHGDYASPRMWVLWFYPNDPTEQHFDHDSVTGKVTQIVARISEPDRINLRPESTRDHQNPSQP